MNINGYRRGEKEAIEEKEEIGGGYNRDWLDDEGFNRDGIYIGGY